MDYKRYILTLSLFAVIIFQQAFGMEGSERPMYMAVSERYFDGETLQGVSFLPKNTLAISSSSATHLIYLGSKQHKKFEENNSPVNKDGSCSILQNKNHTLLITSNEWEVNKYKLDKQRRQKLEMSPGPKYFAFTFNNKLAVYFPYEKAINIQGTLTDLPHKLSYRPIACHPRKNILLLPMNNHTYHKLLINEDDSCSFDNTTQPIIKLKENNDIVGVEYNHDGTLIAVNEFRNGCLLYENEEPLPTWFCYNIAKEEKPLVPQYRSMAFSKNNILILLSWNNTLQFWDCHSKTLMQTISPDSFHEPRFSHVEDLDYQAQSLSISPDGRFVAVIIKNRCFVVVIPERKMRDVRWNDYDNDDDYGFTYIVMKEPDLNTSTFSGRRSSFVKTIQDSARV